MDTSGPNETREAEIEQFAHALGLRAAHLRAVLHSVLARHQVRCRARRSTPASAACSRQRAHEQSQIDHEARHCARRMEHDALVTPQAR